MPTLATQILSFDDFSSLEAHLRVIRDRYKENLKKYEDMLGNILRSNDPTNNSADQKKWTIEMQQNLAGLASRGNTNGAGKDDAKKNLGKLPKLKFANGIGKHKDAGRHVSAQDSEEWISVEQVSILIGQRSKGLAELYFDSINSLKDKITNIDQVISICEKLSTRSSSTSNASLVVSFINDIPSKILVKPANNDTSKKYALMHNIIIPSKAPPSFMRSW